MKRIHLFEFEDFQWFPNSLRMCMTNYIMTFHKLLGTREPLANLVAKALKHSSKSQVIDLCSGAGGPMLDVADELRTNHGVENLQLKLSDLYPNVKAAQRINSQNDPSTEYITESVNAAQVDDKLKGVRTMVCSMHHMRPDIAHNILKDAQKDEQPICIYEISDNAPPIFLWWIAIPFVIPLVFLITPFIRPLTWQQLVFTYLIPVLPFLIAWDGAVSNARTYTIEDMKELTKDLKKDNYSWESGKIKGKGGKKLYLLGLPSLG